MQRLKGWLCESPPVGTGYWCSLARGLYGALLISKIFDLSFPPFHFYDPYKLLTLICGYGIALCLMIGLFSRTMAFAASALCIASYYISALELPNVLNLPMMGRGSFGDPTNVYFVGVVLFFLGLTPCGAYFSIDSVLKKKTPRAETLWGVQLILYQICAMYFWTATAKTNSIFLAGSTLEIAWVKTSVGSLGYYHSPKYALYFQALSIFVVILEYSLAVLFFVPRFRKFGIGLGVLFHVGAMMMFPVKDFTFALLIAFLLFLDSPKDHGRIGAAEAKSDF